MAHSLFGLLIGRTLNDNSAPLFVTVAAFASCEDEPVWDALIGTERMTAVERRL